MDDIINLIHDNDELQVNSFEEIFEPSLLCEYTIHHDHHHHTNHQDDHHTMIKPDQLNNPIMMNNTYHWNNSYDDHDDGLMSSSIQDYYYTCNNSSMLSFGNPSNDNQNVRFGAQLLHNNNDQALVAKQGSKKSSASMAKLSTQVAKHHILAERKRREKLNQRFIALSAIIPGLKKMDKATVLEDAVRYVKELQQQVKTLEDEETKRKTILESAILLGSTSLSQDQQYSSIQVQADDDASILGLEMEARFSYKDVVIRIHCQNKNGILQHIISHIEKLHLLVINTSALLFAPSSLDATIIAQMGGEFNMTAKDLVRHLHAALKELM